MGNTSTYRYMQFTHSVFLRIHALDVYKIHTLSTTVHAIVRGCGPAMKEGFSVYFNKMKGYLFKTMHLFGRGINFKVLNLGTCKLG